MIMIYWILLLVASNRMRRSERAWVQKVGDVLHVMCVLALTGQLLVLVLLLVGEL